MSAPRTGFPEELPEGLRRAALSLMAGRVPAPEVAALAGARTPQALQRLLKRHLGLDATGLAGLAAAPRRAGGAYTLPYGGAFHVGQTLRYLGRDPDNLAERVDGATYRRHFPLDGRQVPLALTLSARSCRVEWRGRLSRAGRLALHLRLRRFLGLEQPLADFARQARGHPVMGPLLARYRGVRVPQVPSLWEALCWAVIGQQINLAFAYRLRNRFIALGNGLAPLMDAAAADNGVFPSSEPLPFPEPERVLSIPEGAWRPAQFSRQKAAYLQGLARQFHEGRLLEAALATAPQEQAERMLGAVRGLGPWSVAYGLLRALGRVDALPVGDAGLRTALRHHFGLSALPDVKGQEQLMEPFRPYRGLATYYLWKSLDQLRQE